jgi:hypothetical protein
MGFGLALRFKLWVYAIGAAVFAIGLAYFKGRSAGGAAVRADHMANRLKDIKRAKEIDDELDALADPYLVDRATQWVRKDDK